MASTTAAIQSFWSCWGTARPRIRAAIAGGPRPDLVEEITRHVKAVDPRLAWELGEGQRAEHALCVTAEGDPELRVVTDRWVRAGPAADATWEYHPARPASISALEATMEIAGRQLVPAQARLLVQAVVVAREVRPDRRSLHLYCDGEGPVPWLVESWSPGRPVTTRWVPDPAWLAVGPFR